MPEKRLLASGSSGLELANDYLYKDVLEYQEVIAGFEIKWADEAVSPVKPG